MISAKFQLISDYIVYFIRSLILFKAPFSLLYYYIKKKSPRDKSVEFRNGLKIYLSNHPHDLITIFVVFIKRDYGLVKQDSVVIDIGANIGAFSLFAAQMGAQKIFAYEPNKEAFDILQKNIRANNVGHKIYPYNLALSDQDNVALKFPKESSPYNTAHSSQDNQNYDLVSTTTLKNIIDTQHLSRVDFLKIDCEGCEFDVFFKTPREVFSKINKIMMEYHQGPERELVEHLEGQSFQVIYHHPHNNIRWLDRLPDPAPC